jgi:uncharacterized delta-60 repeat protein
LLDTTFNTGTGASQVRTVALQPDGKVLIGGYFTTVNGISRARIARLNSDGSVDASFNPGNGVTGFSSDAIVSVIVVQPDGKILIGGDFAAVNGVQRRNIARLNVDGSVDASFNAGQIAADFSAIIMAITIQSDGKILVGGYFSGIGGFSSRGVARLNSDGSVDSAFNTGSGANHGVHAIALEPNGKIVIGGYFTAYNGVTRNKLARINQDGSLDTTFTPNIENTTINVYELIIQRNGKIVIVGNFDRIDGVFRNRVARLNADGSLDSAFISGTDSPVDYVYAAAQQLDGKILIGGSFSSVGGMERYKLARLLIGPIETPTNCSYSVTPTSHRFNSSGGSANITITTQPGCAWTATGDTSWITITEGNNGTGDGAVTFSVAANAGFARTGSLFIAGQNVIVNQAAYVKSRKRARFF